MDGWKMMHIISFLGGAKTTYFLMGDVYCLIFGVDDPPAGSVSKRLLLDRSHGDAAMRHAPCLRSLLPIWTDPYWRPSTALLGSLSVNLGWWSGPVKRNGSQFVKGNKGCTKYVLI